MYPANESCCFDHQGRKEITYHNNATIPTIAEAWTTYYEDAGYSIPTTNTFPSTSTIPASRATYTSYASTTLPLRAPSLNSTPPLSSQHPTPTSVPTPILTSTTSTAKEAAISPSEKIIIGTAGAVGTLGILGAVCGFYLFRRSRIQRSEESRTKARWVGHTELPTDSALLEMDANQAHLHGRYELMGHDRREDLEQPQTLA